MKFSTQEVLQTLEKLDIEDETMKNEVPHFTFNCSLNWYITYRKNFTKNSAGKKTITITA